MQWITPRQQKLQMWVRRLGTCAAACCKVKHGGTVSALLSVRGFCSRLSCSHEQVMSGSRASDQEVDVLHVEPVQGHGPQQLLAAQRVTEGHMQGTRHQGFISTRASHDCSSCRQPCRWLGSASGRPAQSSEPHATQQWIPTFPKQLHDMTDSPYTTRGTVRLPL